MKDKDDDGMIGHRSRLDPGFCLTSAGGSAPMQKPIEGVR